MFNAVPFAKSAGIFPETNVPTTSTFLAADRLIDPDQPPGGGWMGFGAIDTAAGGERMGGGLADGGGMFDCCMETGWPFELGPCASLFFKIDANRRVCFCWPSVGSGWATPRWYGIPSMPFKTNSANAGSLSNVVTMGLARIELSAAKMAFCSISISWSAWAATSRPPIPMPIGGGAAPGWYPCHPGGPIGGMPGAPDAGGGPPGTSVRALLPTGPLRTSASVASVMEATCELTVKGFVAKEAQRSRASSGLGYMT
mmetsp:Transcript_58536/g.156472  ORF Transcript_58536/g.156472 Transcript_58536/m.156472 type:complete len:256 (+) Transcript_58536:331-1098(+)